MTDREGFWRLARREEGAYPQRSVTDEQRSQAPKRLAGRRWLFMRWLLTKSLYGDGDQKRCRSLHPGSKVQTGDLHLRHRIGPGRFEDSECEGLLPGRPGRHAPAKLRFGIAPHIPIAHVQAVNDGKNMLLLIDVTNRIIR